MYRVYHNHITGSITVARTPDEEPLAYCVDVVAAQRIADALNATSAEEPTPEPAPWPTAQLVANDGVVWSREDGDDYWECGGDRVRQYPNEGFTGPVVPVTVVPTAALPGLWSALEQWLNGEERSVRTDDLRNLVGAVVGLREQIDALGLDQ